MNRLEELRKSRNLQRKELAEILGVSTMTVYRYEKGERQISNKNLQKLSEYFGVTIDYILGYKSASVAQEKLDSALSTNSGWREIREIPEVDVTDDVIVVPLVASLHCGYDYTGQPYDIIKGYPIPLQWAKKWGNNLVVNRAKGNSMMPTIRSGDIMVCVPGEAWADGNIVIIDVNDSDTVKRIYRSKDDGGIDLVPDNKDYETVHYTPEELETYQIHVLGRVAKVIGPDLL